VKQAVAAIEASAAERLREQEVERLQALCEELRRGLRNATDSELALQDRLAQASVQSADAQVGETINTAR